MKKNNGTIKSVKKLCNDFFRMEFSVDSDDGVIVSPGQFLTVKISNSSVPLLRRPFAFSGYNKLQNSASIVFQKKGISTEILSGKSPGDSMDFIGPLGNSFSVDAHSKKHYLLSGGIGLGPMLFLASELPLKRMDFTFVFGCRDKMFIPEDPEFSSYSPIIYTDNGSYGYQGRTTDFLNTLSDKELSEAMIYACGPMPMLKACHEFSCIKNIECQVCMEQTMACGVGACMGCVVASAKTPGFVRVCKDGPVFKSKDILWI
jgi:dihydroorotate dehydrogenase electron transfer subunit